MKVQRPGVDATVELDMDLLVMFLDGMKSMLPPTDYDTIVGEVRALIRGELDYAQELHHTARAAEFFAKNVANRVWYHLMGRGIVEPVDDFRDSNPACNDELIDGLARAQIEGCWQPDAASETRRLRLLPSSAMPDWDDLMVDERYLAALERLP